MLTIGWTYRCKLPNGQYKDVKYMGDKETKCDICGRKEMCKHFEVYDGDYVEDVFYCEDHEPKVLYVYGAIETTYTMKG